MKVSRVEARTQAYGYAAARPVIYRLRLAPAPSGGGLRCDAVVMIGGNSSNFSVVLSMKMSSEQIRFSDVHNQ